MMIARSDPRNVEPKYGSMAEFSSIIHLSVSGPDAKLPQSVGTTAFDLPSPDQCLA
jgi:hypothetical protein